MKSRNTSPELALQRQLDRLSINYACHQTDLPGTPDVTVPESRLAIFVNGCYWHRHYACLGHESLTRASAEWLQQFGRIVRRDYRNVFLLAEQGWSYMTLWECELNARPARCGQRVKAQLEVIEESRVNV